MSVCRIWSSTLFRSLVVCTLTGLFLVACAEEKEDEPFGLLYVTNAGDGTVSIIDLELDEVVKTIEVTEKGSHGVAISPDNKRVFVGDMDAGTIFVIETDTNTVGPSFPSGVKAHGIDMTSDGRFLLVSGSFAGEEDDPDKTDRIAFVDLELLEVVGVVETDSPAHIDTNPAGTMAFVTNILGHEITIISVADRKVVATVPVGPDDWEEDWWGPNEVAVSPDGKRAYSADYDGQTVTVIDTATYEVLERIAVPENPHGIVVSPDGQEIWVSNRKSSDVAIIDAATNKIIERIDFEEESPPNHVAFTRDGAKAYVTAGNSVRVVDAPAREIVSTIEVGDTPHELSLED
jgi:YVTN family beta-propeller protein